MIVPDSWSRASISALRKSRRRGRLTQRRSGRPQVVAVLSVLDSVTEVRRRRGAADFGRQQSHFVVDPLQTSVVHSASVSS